MKERTGGGVDDVRDDSLLEGEDHIDTADVVDTEHRDAADPKKDDQELDPEHDLEVVIEEGAEVDDGALDSRPDREEADNSDYSKNVQNRIAREQRIAREARSRAEAAHAGRLAAEAKSRAVQKEALEVTEGALESQIKSTKADLVKAKEDGKTAEEVDLQSALNTLTNRKESLAQAKKQLEREEEEAKRGGGAEGPNQLAEDWKRRNTWFGNARYGEQTLVAAAIDRALAAEGYDKSTPEYFAELDRRVRRRMPELNRLGARREQQQPQQRREPTGGVTRRSEPSGGAERPRGGKVVLNRADLDNMRAFGLDPRDPKHLKEYAANKLAGGK